MEMGLCICFFCLSVGGSWKRFTGDEYKLAITRHNNHIINIWPISLRISGRTRAICVKAQEVFIFCWSMVQQAAVHSFLSSPYLYWTKNNFPLLFSLPLSALSHSRGSCCCCRGRAERQFEKKQKSGRTRACGEFSTPKPSPQFLGAD